jgi:hypothetical protein
MRNLKIAAFGLCGLSFFTAVGLAQEAGLAFSTVQPCRWIDTRNPDGPFGGPSLPSGAVRLFTLIGQCGVPVTARAAAVNVTAVNPTGQGHLTLFPSDQSVPLASTINFGPGQTRANNAIVLLATDVTGAIGVKPFLLGAGTMDLVIDVVGYFAPPPPVSLAMSSPIRGEGDVATTRETILHFSGPLDPASVTPEAVFARAGSSPLTARLYLSTDRKSLTLFYAQPLPPATRIQVTVDGDRLRAETGGPVDADQDGVAGGVGTVEFDTLSVDVVPGTSVCGRVLASELAPGNGGSVDVPLLGVTITVDGAESTLRALTDVNGNFCLDPAPGARFFVHIDGRTAIMGVPPGAYYPFVGKAWDPMPSQSTNIGTIYLPLIAPGTLQPVSNTADTVIHFAPDVITQSPGLADVSLTVPAGSLFADNGTRGGMAGISPVPSNRLPGPLPAGVVFPLVITVQTDGATNFDRPAPVCFPNLADPSTGQPLPPGTKDGLLSFNHDSGRWEYAGPMTVTADGRLICSDPGFGIRAPGWHVPAPPPYEPPPPPPCMGSSAAGAIFAGAGAEIRSYPYCGPACDEKYEREVNNCIAGYAIDLFQCLDGEIDGFFLGFDPGCHWEATETVQRCKDQAARDRDSCPDVCPTPPNSPPPGLCNFSFPLGLDRRRPTLSPSTRATVQDPISQRIDDIHEQIRTLLSPYGPTQGPAPLPQDVIAQAMGLLAQADAAAGGNATAYLQGQVQRRETNLENFENVWGELWGNAPPYPIHYLATVYLPDQVLSLRGLTGPNGQYTLLVPRGGILTGVKFYDSRRNLYGVAQLRLLKNAPYRLYRFVLEPIDETYRDTDHDGLADLVEIVLGTDPKNPDTDGDGVSDSAEVAQGTDPLGRNIAIGQVVDGAISAAGEVDRYSFTASAGQMVYFDLQAGGTLAINWKLVDETGQVVFDSIFFGDFGSVQLTRGGTYTLTVGSAGTTYTGAYRFKLWNVPPPQTFAIAIGDAVSDGIPSPGAGRIESPGTMDIYTFTATPGQTVYFDNQGGGSLFIDWILTDDTGQTIFDASFFGDVGNVTLTKGGTYSLTVGNRGNEFAGTYAFKLWNVPPPQTFAIAIGDAVSDGIPGPGAGRIESPGTMDVYTFTANPGQTVYFDNQGGGSLFIDWILTDDTGQTIFGASFFGDVGNVTLTKGGIYSLTVGNRGNDFAGTYAFKLWNVPPPQTFAITIGDTVSDGVPGTGAGRIETPGVKDVYTFSAIAGQKVLFSLLAGGTIALDWRLTDPTGAVVFGQAFFGNAGPYTLGLTGTYTLTVGSDARDTTGPYSFRLVPQ